MTLYKVFKPIRKAWTQNYSKMPSLASMTWNELIDYKLKLHHDYRDYNIIVGKTKDALIADKYNRLCERIELTLRRVYDELTRREADARRVNMKPY